MSNSEQHVERIANGSDDFQVTIRNCNSIAEATISIRRGALNIKYGVNGVGKSTIARALRLRAEGDSALDALLPFKYRDSGEGVSPTVSGAEEIRKVLVFDERYVSQFAFQRDEVLKDSFEVFINTTEYQRGLAEIEAELKSLKTAFDEQEEFDAALSSFTELRDAFNVTKSGALSKASKGVKAIGMGKKLTNIPEPLGGYKGFLDSDDPAGWIAWQAKGNAFLEVSDNCPFCASVDIDKATARQVSVEYESASVRTLSTLRATVERLGRYIESEKRGHLESLLTSIGDLSPEQAQFLAGLRGQIETFLLKLNNLRGISFETLRDVDDLGAVLSEMKIDLGLLDSLASEDTRTVVELINERLDEVIARINSLRAQVGKLKTRVASLIRLNQAGINAFLASAGYRYRVRIESTADSYRMILEHEDAKGHVESASEHLSYGEKNAFALILFMYHVRRERPDLAVLDDPVSSFDKTKKFAILHQLFHGDKGMGEFTTLLLTHDIEPAIDIFLNPTSRKFTAVRPSVHFLQGRAGVVVEKRIERSHISTFVKVCDVNIQTSADDVIKCIYLRRKLEVLGNRGGDAYHVLSSLVHLREAPDCGVDNNIRIPMPEARLAAAVSKIQESIPDFDYDTLLNQLKDADCLKRKFDDTSVGYEKVQLFRIMMEADPGRMAGDDAFRKFVNETFHIENEYLMQLNPREFDAVPDHVVRRCEDLADQTID